MSGFDERKQKFEARFAHDAEARFKAEARRDKLVGAWAAETLGLKGDAAADYVRSVIKADMEEPGEEDVFRKLRADLPPKVTDEEIRAQMADAMQTVLSETKP